MRASARRVERVTLAQERCVEVLALDHLGHLLGGREPLVVDADHRDDLRDARDELLVAVVQRLQVVELDLRLDVAAAHADALGATTRARRRGRRSRSACT